MLPVTLLITLVFTLVIIIFIFSLFIKRKKKQLSGESGEEKVSNLLNKIKEKEEVVINNFLASRNKEKTYSIQIDHIFISHKGIFVIETKDYHGKIYGKRFLNNWKQVIGNKENIIYNPVKQNATHSKYIFEKLNKKYYCHNIVIFTSGEVNYDLGCEGNIFSLESFYLWYTKLEVKRYLTTKEINYIQDRINYLQNTYTITIDKHIQNIKNNHFQ